MAITNLLNLPFGIYRLNLRKNIRKLSMKAVGI